MFKSGPDEYSVMTDSILVKEIGRRALFYDKFSGCSQSVLLALQEGLGVGDRESFKAATVLSGGVARRGETCGALLGALMAVGLVEGRSRMPDTSAYAAACAEADAIATEFQRRVEKEFKLKEPLKSTICWDIQRSIYGRSYDLRDTVQRESFYACGGHGDEGCPKVCGIAAEVAAERLLPKVQMPS
jgi:C_GCAxxG_C_C family probable redox protein